MKYLLIIATLFLAGCGSMTLPDGSRFPANPELTKKDSGILSTDKGLHFLLGMGTGTVTDVVLQYTTTLERDERKMYGCAAAATVGIAKEFYDRDIMGTRFETLDAIYTAAGCLFTFEWVF